MVIKCNYIQHKYKSCILLGFPYNDSLNNVFKRLEFIKYSNTHKGCYIPQNRKLLQEVIDAFTTIVTVEIKDW